jgi:RNA polymerase sigma-70 factor (ECF subfamily)
VSSAAAAFENAPGVGGEDWAQLRRFCVREAMQVLRHREDAEEAAQEALIRAWRGAEGCRGSSRLPWVRQISRNEALRLAARRARLRRELSAEPVSETAAVDDPALLRVPVTETVRDALSQLTAADRLLIRLRYAEDLTQPQLARVLGLPEGTVKVRLHRARRRLTTLLLAQD